MPSLGGLISGVFGGAAQAYGEGAQMEMKKQSELDLRKQLLEAESDKRLREDEIKRGRDVSDRVTEEARVQSPEYLAKAASTSLTKATGDIANRTTLAPLAAGADVAEGTARAGVKETLAPVNAKADVAEGIAKAGVQVTLAPEQAKVARAQFDAEKELRSLKVAEATTDQITKAKTLVADKGYMDALEKTDLAAHAHLIKIANIRATSLEGINEDRLEAARLKALKGPGSTTPTTADLQRQVTAAENALAAKLAVKKTDLNYELGNLQKRTDPASKVRLEKATGEIAALDAARKRLTDWSKTPAAEAPAAAAPTLPPLKPGMFEIKK